MHTKFALPVRLTLLLLTLSLTGCGLTQSIKKGTAIATHAIFYPKADILHLQLVARNALNNDEAQMPSPVEVRIWPLRNAAAFRQASYSMLLKQDAAALDATLSGEPVRIRVLPGNTTTVDIPLADDVQLVAVAAFFLSPDIQRDSWRLTVSRENMDADTPTIIELNNQDLRVMRQE